MPAILLDKEGMCVKKADNTVQTEKELQIAREHCPNVQNKT